MNTPTHRTRPPTRRRFVNTPKTTPAPALSSAPVFLGVGVLNWPRVERVGDRYGIVYLSPESGGYHGTPVQRVGGRFAAIGATTPPLEHAGESGRLVAKVIATRESGHIGDFFHGVSPRTPEVGAAITLGDGALVFEDIDGIDWKGVGVRPADGRETLWMDLRALYDCHDQTVELWFHPTTPHAHP